MLFYVVEINSIYSTSYFGKKTAHMAEKGCLVTWGISIFRQCGNFNVAEDTITDILGWV